MSVKINDIAALFTTSEPAVGCPTIKIDPVIFPPDSVCSSHSLSYNSTTEEPSWGEFILDETTENNTKELIKDNTVFGEQVENTGKLFLTSKKKLKKLENSIQW